MRILLIWTVLAGFAGLGVSGAYVVAHYLESPQRDAELAAGLASNTSDVGRSNRIAVSEEPTRDDESGWQTVPSQPAVSSQLGSLVQGIQDVSDKLTGQQRALLETLQEIKQQSEQAAAPHPVADADQPAATDGDVAAEAKRTTPVIESEGDDRLRINIQDADIRDVLEMLSRHGDINILPGPNVSGQVNATLSGVTVEEALGAILRSAQLVARREGNFVYVGTPEDLQAMQQSSEPIVVRVFRPNYVNAADLQTLIAPLLSASGEATVGGSKVSISAPAQVGIPSDPTSAGGDAFAGSEVVIVRDYQSIVTQIETLVKEVDQRPRQVAIEAVIVGVRIDDNNALGVNFELLRNKNNVRLISGSPLNSLAAINVDSGGLKFGFLDSSLSAFVDALETVGDTNVVASPRIVCLNKQRAEILIGSELGYVSTTVTENSATQSVEFLEVGTQLRIRPFISDDRMVRLEVHPELSTGSVRVEQGLTLPDKEVTQVTTNVLCPDGKTLVIGGLIREDLTTTSSHIPYLGRAPLIGPLFRRETETTEKREIIICLTPRIIDDPWASSEDAEITSAFLRRQAIYADKMSMLGTRHKGRLYLRLAKSAWQAGDVVASFRYVQVALHFDPDNLEANNLRAQIIRTRPELDLPIRRRLREGLPAWERPLRNYSKQGHRWQDPINYVPGSLGTEGETVLEVIESEGEPTPVDGSLSAPPRPGNSGQ